MNGKHQHFIGAVTSLFKFKSNKMIFFRCCIHNWKIKISCTPDRNCHTFCLGDKIASHPGVLTQSKKNTQNLEINQIFGVVVQEKESNMVFCSRWKFPTLGMTVLSGTSAEPRFRSARSSLGLETSI